MDQELKAAGRLPLKGLVGTRDRTAAASLGARRLTAAAVVVTHIFRLPWDVSSAA